MASPTRQLPIPHGVLRWLLRLPINLYHLRLGWLLGERFMLLEHLGRKTGKWHSVVIEVVGHDDPTDTYFAASGWNLRSDWYRNILAHPQVRLSTGHRRRLTAIAHVLDAAAAGDRLVDYARRHPIAMRELAEIMGFPKHETEADLRSVAETLPIIGFNIGPWPETSPDQPPD
jgi:deazaflavin-dependent oxidoreductase (nitroreductase family)